jgi:hypothetical protein
MPQAIVTRATESRHWKARAAVLAAALWWGSVSTIGFLVVPLRFGNLPSPAIAGSMAAKLFSAQAWLALGCGLALLLASRDSAEPAGMGWARGALLFVFAGLLLALLSEFAVAPRILARDNLKLWHAVGSTMYVLQWLCATVVLWKVTGSQSPSPRT